MGQVLAADIKPGDVIKLPQGGWGTVTRKRREGSGVVCYVKGPNGPDESEFSADEQVQTKSLGQTCYKCGCDIPNQGQKGMKAQAPTGPHCQSCGRPQTATADNEGYSSCCNERIVYPPCGSDCYHAERGVPLARGGRSRF